MKKKLGFQSLALTALMVAGATGASASVPLVSELPLEEGIVIDTTTGTVDAQATAEVSGNTGTTAEVSGNNGTTTEEAQANDGTSLPLDEGDVNATEPDTGAGVVEVAPAPTETVAPQDDTVTLAAKEVEPKVEPLAQTGIADNGMLYAGLAVGLGLMALVVTRLFRTREV